MEANMPSKERKEVITEAKVKAEKYKKALLYLDSCDRLSYKALVETNRIAGNVMTKARLREMWDMSKNIINGAEFNKQALRETLIEGIQAFESVADGLGKKWWQFWK
jgi:hypothetical protein